MNRLLSELMKKNIRQWFSPKNVGMTIADRLIKELDTSIDFQQVMPNEEDRTAIYYHFKLRNLPFDIRNRAQAEKKKSASKIKWII